MNRFFELEPLPLPYLLLLAAITLGYAMATEAAKGWFFRHEGGWGGQPPNDRSIVWKGDRRLHPTV